MKSCSKTIACRSGSCASCPACTCSHDHQTTATIGVYEGAEDNHFYLCEPGKLLHKSTRRVGPGEVIALKPDGIHSVEAADGTASCGIYVYLVALTKIERSLFNWDSGEIRPFTDENYDAMLRIVG